MNIHPLKVATLILTSLAVTACVWAPPQPSGYRMTSQTLPTYVNGQYVGMQPNNYAYPNPTNEVQLSSGGNEATVQSPPVYLNSPVYMNDPVYGTDPGVNYQGYPAYPSYGYMNPWYVPGFGYWDLGIGIGAGYYGGGYYGGGYGWHGRDGRGGYGGHSDYGNPGWRGNHSSSGHSGGHGGYGAHGGGHR